MIWQLLVMLVDLIIVRTVYTYFMPVYSWLTYQLISQGAPLEQSLQYLDMARWGFIIFFVAIFVWAAGSLYKEIYVTEERF